MGDDELQMQDDEASRPATALSDAPTVSSTQPKTTSSQSLPMPEYQGDSDTQFSQPKKAAPKKEPKKAAPKQARSKRTPSEDAYSIPSSNESDLDFGGGSDGDAAFEKRVFRERKPKAKTEEPKLSGICL